MFRPDISDDEDYGEFDEEDYDDDDDDFLELDYDDIDWNIPVVLDHEMFLFMYIPEEEDGAEEKDVTVFDVLKIADMTIKLHEAIELRKVDCDCDIGIFDLENIDVNSHYVTALMVENLIGGKQKFDVLRKLMRNVKNFTMTSLRASLSDVLPTEISLEEDILDNILQSMNLLEAYPKAKELWKFVEDSEEEKRTLSNLFERISRVFGKMRDDLFSSPTDFEHTFLVSELSPELIDQLQEVVDRVCGTERSNEEKNDVECGADDVQIPKQLETELDKVEDVDDSFEMTEKMEKLGLNVA